MPEKPARESAFWRFSLDFYALPEIAPACLALQDEAGVDVNVMLYLLFLASSKREAKPEHVSRLDAAIRDWREKVVKPLRTLRRDLKAGIGQIAPAASEGFRNMVKKLELESERLEQHKLERTGAGLSLPEAPSPQTAARANLAAYAQFLGGEFPQGPLTVIVSGFAASHH
jgi:uncharacterized protein (TIGR02444 family)